MNSDKDISAFDQRLADHVKEKWSNYERLRLDLTEARNYLLFDIPGEFLAVERVSSSRAIATIRLDRPNRQDLNFDQARIVETLFERFFVSNAALTGEWMDLIIGRNFRTWKDSQANNVSEALQVLNVTNVAANANTVCAAGAVQAAIIKADVENTDIAWIDYGVPAVQSNCYPLDPGEWVIVPLSNTNRINVNFEVANEIVYVTPIV
jgi:hypothetical protein